MVSSRKNTPTIKLGLQAKLLYRSIQMLAALLVSTSPNQDKPPPQACDAATVALPIISPTNAGGWASRNVANVAGLDILIVSMISCKRGSLTRVRGADHGRGRRRNTPTRP